MEEGEKEEKEREKALVSVRSVLAEKKVGGGGIHATGFIRQSRESLY